MSAFVPPYPQRPREPLRPLAMISAARRNFLEVFEDKCFEYQFFSTRLLNRRLFVCNSPDTVAQAFIALHTIYRIICFLLGNFAASSDQDDLFDAGFG